MVEMTWLFITGLVIGVLIGHHIGVGRERSRVD